MTDIFPREFKLALYPSSKFEQWSALLTRALLIILDTHLHDLNVSSAVQVGPYFSHTRVTYGRVRTPVFAHLTHPRQNQGSDELVNKTGTSTLGGFVEPCLMYSSLHYISTFDSCFVKCLKFGETTAHFYRIIDLYLSIHRNHPKLYI